MIQLNGYSKDRGIQKYNGFYLSEHTSKINESSKERNFFEGEVEMIYGKGISKTAEIIDLAVDQDIIVKYRAWYDYNDGELKRQGKELMKEALEEHPEIMTHIEKFVRETISNKKVPQLIKSMRRSNLLRKNSST